MTYGKVLMGTIAAALMIAGAFVAPAYAHQRQLFTIGDRDYLMIIGSLNEPIFVDDKTGVDLRVLHADPNDPMNSNAPGVTPVEGLERTLRVELAAGGKTQELVLEPAFGSPGAYRAPFYPTVQTTYEYRLFGSINDTPVNLTFTCTPAGEAGATPDNSEVQISEGVIRKSVAGGYGCPESRSAVGFPEPFASNNDVNVALAQIQDDVESIKSSVGTSISGDNSMVWAGIGLGIAGIAIGAVAMTRRK